MDNEFETKVLKIDKEVIIEKLRQLGAKEEPEKLQKRYIFDMTSESVEWIRLRTDGTTTTMTYKHKVRGNTEIGKTVEIEVEVADFEKTAQILSKIHFKDIYYQENKRHIFHLGDIEYSIDSWPMLEPYLEVEGGSQEKVREGLQLVGLEGQDVGDADIVDIYKKEKGIHLHDYKELKFKNS